MEAVANLRLRPIRTKPAAKANPINADEEEELEPVTPAGRVFCNPLFNCHILVIFGLKNPIHLQTFKDGIRSTLLKHKRFCSVVRKGKNGELCWVRTTVNLDDHLVIPTITDHDKNSANFVEDYVADLAQATPLDMRRPLFEYHILDAKLGEAVENVVFRVHHALGDGISLMSLLLACTKRVDQPDSLPTLPSKPRKISQTRRKASIAMFWQEFFSLLWRLLLIAWYTFLDICNFTATSLWMDDSPTPIKGYAGVENRRKRLAHKTVSLEDIRMVKQAIKGTVNDVMFGMLAAGLSRYMQHRYDEGAKEPDPDKLETPRLGTEGHPSEIQGNSCDQKKKLLAHLRVRASALVNTRPSPGLHEMQDMMCGGSQSRWGNQMGYVILPIPISDHKDALEFVHKAKRINDRKKLSLEAVFTYNSGTLLMKLTGAEMPTKLTYRCASHATMSFSNVMGPLEEIQFFGNPIAHIIPTVSGQPQSLCIHVQSYMGKVTIIVFAVQDIIPDPEELCNFMASALEEMKKQVTSGLVNGTV